MQLPDGTGKRPLKKKNVAREKIVEAEILAMCQEIGMDVDVIDSKATYSKNLERYTASQAAPVGFSDIVGNDRDGRAVYIEIKARGKLSTLRREQYEFLSRKLQAGCFAVAVDCPDDLLAMYVRWRQGDVELLRAVLEKLKPA